MIRTVLPSLACVALLLSAPALAGDPAPAHPGREASIAFVDQHSIQNWHAEGRDTLYVQDLHNRWYRATVMGDCFDLPFAETIGFDASGTNTLDKFGAVIVRGQRCPFTSFVESGPPPREQARHSN